MQARASMLLLAAVTGCASAASVAERADRPDAGGSSGDGGRMAAPPMLGTHIREDFDNDLLIDRVENVVIDFNKGQVTLPTLVFPEISSDQLATYTNSLDANGSVQASDIVLDQHATLVASDSIELLAKHLLRVTGEIHAGAGGVTLVAGDQVIIDGIVDSEGPVKILLGSNTGTVAIAGTVNAISSTSETADIRIIARGIVTVTGQVMTSADMGRVGGDVLISAYGKITVSGAGAQVAASARDFGTAGNVHIKSETAVEISNGAFAGGLDLSSTNGPMMPPMVNKIGLAGAGDVEVQAPHVTLGTSALLSGASTSKGTGGSVLIVAGEQLETLQGATITSGSGDTSGSITVHSVVTNIGYLSQVMGGTGGSMASDVDIESSGPMTLGRSASIVGGVGGCASGGNVYVHVGDMIQVSPGSSIKGGGGGQLVSTLGCDPTLHSGGNVEVKAKTAPGIEGVVSAGMGSTPGEVHVITDSKFMVAPPVLEAGTSGSVTSKTVDRGDANLGRAPILVEARYNAPLGTQVTIQLGGAATPDGPFDFVDLPANPPHPAYGLKDDRYFKYRVLLSGRAFDTPVLDYFDIDLAPMSLR